MQLDQDQQKIVDELIKWTENATKAEWIDIANLSITIGGYAGTGKTTILGHFRKMLKEKHPRIHVAFCAYTGKAAQVLKNKLYDSDAIFASDSTSTIHGLIYTPIEDEKDRIIGWERKDEIDADLIIIDEASMVNEAIWKDISEYSIPIIAVGDHGQLAPIRGQFNLMADPKYKLEKIYRQQDENPIIKLSIHARTFGKIIPKEYSKTVQKISKADEDYSYKLESILNNYDISTLILCGYNNTRVKLNKFLRSKLGFETPEPQIGDKVICLRNNHEKGIYNGMFGTIQHIENADEKRFYAEIFMEDTNQVYMGHILKEQFNSTTPLNFGENRYKTLESDLFDFGYAVTVHKAQGSQAKKVIFFEEPIKQMDPDNRKRWLYTAVTRSQDELYIIG